MAFPLDGLAEARFSTNPYHPRGTAAAAFRTKRNLFHDAEHAVLNRRAAWPMVRGQTSQEARPMPPRPSQLPRDAFVARFGGVFEHSPWIAVAAWDRGLGPDADTAEGLHARLCAVLRSAGAERQLALIHAHPDLAGKLAQAKRLTEDSAQEQASAGLDRLTPGELARFTELNDAYRARFGFPFVVAVRGLTKVDILAAFERRLANDPDAERQAALEQVERIALLRLKEQLPSSRGELAGGSR
jgi:OHCU decarboxylase